MKTKKPMIWLETIFDSFYLLYAASIGLYLIITAASNSLRQLYGVMALLLMIGDSFHLIPRIYSFFSPKTKAITTALGIGKCISSITMTIFYVMLSYIFFDYYQYIPSTLLISVIWILAGLRMFFCLYPISQWTRDSKKIFFNILRNIPFILLGMIVIILFIQQRGGVANVFANMWISILLSFAFYIPVVLFATKYPRTGMLMLPKTCMYIWMLSMGLLLW